MSRKTFIESQGATCRNWNWSWSFINEKKEFIIFGAWDKNTEGSTALILDEDWQRNYAGRKNPAYPEAREHIRLVEEEGYSLKTFPIIYSNERKDENGIGPAKIKGFVPEVTSKILKGSEGSGMPQMVSSQIYYQRKWTILRDMLKERHVPFPLMHTNEIQRPGLLA